jgi:hypothetical protein
MIQQKDIFNVLFKKIDPNHQIWKSKINGNMFQPSTHFVINCPILTCFGKCMSKPRSLVTFDLQPQ